MQQLQNNFKIGIYSLGLIGGSIYKALIKNGGAEVYACTSNDETFEMLQKEGAYVSKYPDILSECDVIFVCSPISKTAETIKKLFEINKNALFADVASLKADITAEIEKTEGCRFIGTHPMAGTEFSGYNASFAELFEGAVWVLTPPKDAKQEDINLLSLLTTLMGAKPIIMNSLEHDRAVAAISHLPMLLSQSLMLSFKDDNNAMKLAASGFRDMTRLALSNKIMAKDMLALNKENIKQALNDVINSAQELLKDDVFDKNIDAIISARAKLYNSSGKNNFTQSNE